MELVATDNEHVLGYVRVRDGDRLVIFANFSEELQAIDGNRLRTAGMGRFSKDVITETTCATSEPVALEPYQVLWLKRV